MSMDIVTPKRTSLYTWHWTDKEQGMRFDCLMPVPNVGDRMRLIQEPDGDSYPVVKREFRYESDVIRVLLFLDCSVEHQESE